MKQLPHKKLVLAFSSWEIKTEDQHKRSINGRPKKKENNNNGVQRILKLLCTPATKPITKK
jgi:hypothetical protein